MSEDPEARHSCALFKGRPLPRFRPRVRLSTIKPGGSARSLLGDRMPKDPFGLQQKGL